MPRHARGFDVEAAYDHLSRRDRRLGAWMKRLGPLPAEPRWRKPFDPVDALAEVDAPGRRVQRRPHVFPREFRCAQNAPVDHRHRPTSPAFAGPV